MPRGEAGHSWARRRIGFIVAVLFFCAGAQGPPQPASVPASRPAVAEPAPPETIAAARARLARLRSSEISDQSIVLKTALELTLAIGRADGQAAAALIDAVGYQVLPAEGDLPENPAKPTPREDIRTVIQARRAGPLGGLPASSFQVLDREGVRKVFAAVGEWMLPTDWAVVIDPVEGEKNWVSRRCCIVVRMRARKPTILGGNLFEALKAE